MVKIDPPLCIACGECVDICHESCMKLDGKTLIIDYGSCSTCGQCIAICAKQALQWDDNEPEKITSNNPVSPEQLRKFLAARRTNRHFKPEKPPMEMLEKIINMGAYAPAHEHHFRAIVAYEDKTIDIIDKALYETTKKIYDLYFKNKLVKSLLLSLLPPSLKREFIKGEPKLSYSMKIGRAYEIRPPVIVYLVSAGQPPLTLESAQYILYNMDLYSRTLGLGCRILTGNNMFINKNKAVRKVLGLKKGEVIQAAAAFGYVSKNFRNIVTGRKIQTNRV